LADGNAVQACASPCICDDTAQVAREQTARVLTYVWVSFKLRRRLGASGKHSMTIAPASCKLPESGCKSAAAMLAAAALNVFQQSSMPGFPGWGTAPLLCFGGRP